MTINWTEIILALLGTNGITLLISMLLFKQKKEKMETEIDSSTLDNLEKGFAIQGAQLKKAQEATYRDWETDRKSTRLNSSHSAKSRMPSSA